MDSLDKDNHIGKWSYMDLPDPAKGGEGYPRMLIENRAYCTQVFRKLHIELAHRQDGLQVQLYPANGVQAGNPSSAASSPSRQL